MDGKNITDILALLAEQIQRMDQLFDRMAAQEKVSEKFETLAGAAPGDNFGFFARVGVSAVPQSRSIRKDLPDLMEKAEGHPKTVG